jgi:hypothetical protein
MNTYPSPRWFLRHLEATGRSDGTESDGMPESTRQEYLGKMTEAANRSREARRAGPVRQRNGLELECAFIFLKQVLQMRGNGSDAHVELPGALGTRVAAARLFPPSAYR